VPIETYLAFVAASAALVAVPGPNVALIVANSVAHGHRYGLLTVAGTGAAMVPQLALTALGTTGALARWT
jgi:threonine/homoserine/homoserine lactone efflux protein